MRPHSSNSIENAPHHSQSSRENANQSSGTSPLTSYKTVTPPPRDARVLYVSKLSSPFSRLATNAFPDFGSVGRIKNRKE